MRSFFDTNVLLYLTSADAKAARAEALLAGGGIVSVQVLNEFAAVARRKFRMDWPEIRETLMAVRAACDIVPIAIRTHDRGVDIAEQFGFQIYDSLIIAAALETGCSILYSEDMQHGQIIEGLTILNPFAKL